jgi:hypothetical protein
MKPTPFAVLRLYLERFDTMALDLYLDVGRATFVWKWAKPGKATVGEYRLADLTAN